MTDGNQRRRESGTSLFGSESLKPSTALNKFLFRFRWNDPEAPVCDGAEAAASRQATTSKQSSSLILFPFFQILALTRRFARVVYIPVH